jgi:hypothetical protein
MYLTSAWLLCGNWSAAVDHFRPLNLVAALARLAIANVDDRLEIRLPRRFGNETHLSPAIDSFEVETLDWTVGKRRIAFRSVIAAAAARDRADIYQVAAHGDLGFSVNPQPDIALSFAGRNVGACHFPYPELSICPNGQGSAEYNPQDSKTF